VTGQVVAQTLNVQQVTSSIVYSSGSNIFGNSLANTQQFTGSVSVTGSLAVAGALSSGTLTINGADNRINSGNELRFYRTDNAIYTRLYDGGNTDGFVLDNRNGEGFSFQAAGTNQLRIASTGAATFSGNLTTNGKLTVSQASTDFVAEIINTQNATPYGLRIKDAASGANNYPLFSVSNNAGSVEYFRVNSGTGTATFSSSVTAPFIRITDSAGEIGEINSTNANGGYITWRTSGTTIADLGTAQQIFGSGGNDTFGINGRGARALTFGTNNTERLRITSGGNVGIGTTGPSGRLHVTSTGITASSPSKGWPVHDAELDTNARSIYIDTAGNGDTATAASGATVAIQLGQYYDSRVVITPPGSGGASPSDQGTGRGKDLMIKAGTSDNGAGLKGGRLYLNGGMGYQSAFNANGGDILMQVLTGSGNVGIGTATPSQKLEVVGGEIKAGRVDSSSEGGQVSFGRASDNNTAWYIDAYGSTSSPQLRFVNVSDSAVAMTLNSTGNLAVGTTDIPTLSTPNGGQLIVMPNAVIVSGIIALGSPYTQNIQIDIVYNNWGGNNVIGLVDMIITLREYANTGGTAFGKVFATNSGAGATFSSFNTTNVTTSQCSVTATSGGNYTLRITIDPSNITDRGSFYLTIPNAGGTGSTISSITVSYV
jgi:hypothetical protein